MDEQHPRFDLSRLRNLRLSELRDRVMQQPHMQALGEQLTRVRDRVAQHPYTQALGEELIGFRQRPLRADYLIPLAALVLLVGALAVSYGSNRKVTRIAADQTHPKPNASAAGTATITPSSSTAVAARVPTFVVPAPGKMSGPVPVGPPGGGPIVPGILPPRPNLPVPPPSSGVFVTPAIPRSSIPFVFQPLPSNSSGINSQSGVPMPYTSPRMPTIPNIVPYVPPPQSGAFNPPPLSQPGTQFLPPPPVWSTPVPQQQPAVSRPATLPNTVPSPAVAPAPTQTTAPTAKPTTAAPTTAPTAKPTTAAPTTAVPTTAATETASVAPSASASAASPLSCSAVALTPTGQITATAGVTLTASTTLTPTLQTTATATSTPCP